MEKQKKIVNGVTAEESFYKFIDRFHNNFHKYLDKKYGKDKFKD